MSQALPTNAFRPRARMLLQLGDQLIRDSGLAVFELVKNAYDADATNCKVSLINLNDEENGKIVVEDDGSGMDITTVKGVWLEPGTDYRAKQKLALVRTSRFKRLPLGEKGLGRFAVHKLGKVIELITRKKGKREVVVRMNWKDFESDKYLAQVPVSVTTRTPTIFTGKRTGTRIEVTKLRDIAWTKRKVRDLHRSITSICSPFSKPGNFRAELVLEPPSDWLGGLVSVSTVLKQSLFRATGKLKGSKLSYNYEFVPSAQMLDQIEERAVSQDAELMMEVDRKRVPLDLSKWKIGDIKFNLRVFDREPQVLDLVTSDKAGLKKFLDQNGGIRVYRDGIRVFDFGEPGNDWLDLGGRRVNIPTLRISNNQVIGAIHLRGEDSTDLIEKTNREGFIENDAFDAFQQAVLFAVSQVEAERRIDKARLRQFYSRGSKNRQPVVDDLADLREEIKKHKLTKELGPYVDRIEKQFEEVRDRLMTAAGAGLTLTTVIHEVEKIIKEVVAALKKNVARDRVTSLVDHLASMVDGLSYLVRKSGKSKEKASLLVGQAVFNVEYRLKAHNISLVNGFDKGTPDFSESCVRRLVIATLMNLIDNSIYWLDAKGAKDKRIYVGTLPDPNHRGIVVADNGPGFLDPPDYLVEPFFSRKPDGMGLGLHFANEIAKLHGGRLWFPEAEEIGLSRMFDGAVVVLELAEKA